MLKTILCFIFGIILQPSSVKAWSGFENLGGGINHIASASWGPGRFDIFGVASDGSVWHKAFAAGSWSDWSSIGGAAAFKPSAFSIKNNWVDIVYTGSDKRMYRKTWDGSKWIDWKVSTNGGAFQSGPSITASDSSNVHVFGVGLDAQLYHCAINIGSSEWSSWEALGGGLVGDPAAISWGPGRFDVFAIAGDEQLWQKTYDDGWRGWNVVSGGLFNPGVGVASKGPGIINVFLTGKDNSVFHRQYSNGNWGSLESLGGKIRGSPSGASPGSTRADVFVVGGSDGACYRNFWETRTSEREE